MIFTATPERKLWVERKNSLKYVFVIGYIKLVCFSLKTLDTGKKMVSYTLEKKKRETFSGNGRRASH